MLTEGQDGEEIEKKQIIRIPRLKDYLSMEEKVVILPCQPRAPVDKGEEERRSN